MAVSLILITYFVLLSKSQGSLIVEAFYVLKISHRMKNENIYMAFRSMIWTRILSKWTRTNISTRNVDAICTHWSSLFVRICSCLFAWSGYGLMSSWTRDRFSNGKIGYWFKRHIRNTKYETQNTKYEIFQTKI